MTIMTTGIDAYINAAYEQSVQFKHCKQTEQQAIKQAILLGLVEDYSERIYVRDLVPETTIFSYTKIDDTYRPGWLLRDMNNHNIIVTDGVTMGCYLTKNVGLINDNIYVGTGLTRRSTVAAPHDGRHATALYLKDYAIGSSTDYIMFNDYLIMNLLCNEEARDILRDALLSEEQDSTKLVCNHKNNRTTDISADNLEFCSPSLNHLHGQFIQMLSQSKKYNWLCGTPYYVAKSKSGDTGKWVTPLKIKLSAYDIAAVLDDSIDNLLEMYNIKKEDIQDENQ